MTTLTMQAQPTKRGLSSLATSFTRAVNALVGNQHLLAEFSATAAHYDGLIDAIERAGWDLSRLERVKHAFDETAETLLGELTESLPDMSHTEEQSFLMPFRSALQQFARMTSREKLAFRSEYSRFSELHARSLEQFTSEDLA